MSWRGKVVVALLLVAPAAHPLVPMHAEVFPSEVLWWVHVVPVAVLAYEHGILGSVVGVLWSSLASLLVEQFLGPGLAATVDLTIVREVTGPLVFTNTLVLGLALYGRHAAEELRHEASHDDLTGLPNRQMLLDMIEERIGQRDAHRGSGTFALLFVDMDDFKLYNDSLGHGVGNQLLVRFAKRLRHCVRGEDTVARWGGDEFVLLLDRVDSAQSAVEIAERIHSSLEVPVEAGGQRVRLQSSIGVALGGSSDADAEELVARADSAMYRAKVRGKNEIAVFDSSEGSSSASQVFMKRDLVNALERGEFFFAYQPIVSAEDHALAGFEALLRWRHPQHGTLTPGRFLPIAEDTDLMLQIGDFVCVEACKILSRWQRSYPEREGVFLSINVSPRQLAGSGFTRQVLDLCRQNDVPPERLKVEIVESSLLEGNEATRRNLSQLREAGFELALDDFGTGYSSLSYLHQYPLSFLKIDRTFVNGLGVNQRNQKILQAVVALSSQLGYRTVAEGVENSREAARVRYMGCDFIQGYHIARPMSLSEAESLLAREESLEPPPDARSNGNAASALRNGTGPAEETPGPGDREPDLDALEAPEPAEEVPDDVADRRRAGSDDLLEMLDPSTGDA